jgi:hypothetical protein
LLLHPYPTFPEITEPEPTDEPLLTKIVPYTEHADTIRRGGALGCIKNCAMDRASHAFLLATEGELFPEAAVDFIQTKESLSLRILLVRLRVLTFFLGS